jgi:hypothetical protein
MRVLQKIYQADNTFSLDKVMLDFSEFTNDSLFFIFINKERSFWIEHLTLISAKFPSSSFVGATSAGQIGGEFIYDNECVITALKFKKAKFFLKTFEHVSSESSFDIGKQIAMLGNEHDVHSALIFSEGLNINGTKLSEGINLTNKKIVYSGGLSGDGSDFKETLVFTKDKFIPNAIAVVYFDKNVEFRTSAAGGWTSFGIERRVTKSHNNIVYEIDEKPAINLYNDYLGSKAKLLPSYGLHFPICLTSKNNNAETELVRTLLAIDEVAGSLTFAGDVNEGCEIKLMKSTTKDLIHSAQSLFAEKLLEINNLEGDVFSFLVSCVGRRLVMGQNTEEEFVLPPLPFEVIRTGYYSYGELSKSIKENKCSLHNQTFTLTLIWEKRCE